MPLKNFLRNINRRTFLKAASITGIAGLVFPRNLFASLAPSQLSRVVIVEDSTATSGLSINAAVVQVMMDRGITALSDQYDVGEAWKAQFPGINASSTIAIKLNCLNYRLPSHIEVTDAVVEGLKQMSLGGSPFPENNIIIYDNENYYLTSCGYTINTSASGVRESIPFLVETLRGHPTSGSNFIPPFFDLDFQCPHEGLPQGWQVPVAAKPAKPRLDVQQG